MKIKKTVTAIVISCLLLSLFPIQKTEATVGECVIGTVCAYKDVYDFQTSTYHPEIANGVELEQNIFRIGIWNTSGSPIHNVRVHDVLPSGLTYIPTTVVVAGYTGTYNDQDLFNGTGINFGTVANSGSIQLNFLVRVDDLPEGNYTLTNNATITWDGGSISDTASVYVEAQDPPVNEGILLVNEINHAPRADYSAGSSYALKNRTAVNADDQWIEVFIRQNGLDLSDSRWEMTITNNGGSTDTRNLLTIGSSYEYFGSGSVTNTVNGAYLLLANPYLEISNDAIISIKYNGITVDDMTVSGSNTGLLDETIGRNESSTDTNSNSDFSRNHGTPGRANEQRSQARYEAEIYIDSQAGNERGIDVIDAGASRGIAKKLEPAFDLAGNIMNVSSSAQNAAGYYKAILRLKAENADLNSSDHFAEFNINYDNGTGGYHTIGYAIRGRDIVSNGVYQNFEIEFRKGPSTTNSVFELSFIPSAGTTVIVDYIEVAPFSPNNSLPRVYEAENMHFKTGYRADDAGTAVAFGPKSEANADSFMSFGPFTASHITGIGSGQFLATYRMRFANITGSASDLAVRIDVHNKATGIYRERFLRVADLSGSYKDFEISFPATGQGSIEFRVINLGAADIYFDKVTVTSTSSASISYEAESDFEYPIAPVATLINAGASGTQEVKADTAINAEGFLIRGPHAFDQTETSKYYEASFRLRTDSPASGNSLPAALLFIRNIDTGQILTSQIVHANTLVEDYRSFKLVFNSPIEGRLSYEVYFLRTTNVIADNVVVTELPGNPNPRVSQAEQLRRWNNNGSIVEDSKASNSIGHTSGYAVQALSGINNNQVVLFSDSQEVFPSGNYEAKFHVRGTLSGGSSQDIAYLEVWNEFGHLNYYPLKESELDTEYGVFTVPFTKVSNGRIYFKVFYRGGLSNSMLIDKIEVNML
ncbi:MAG: hypothetical protein QY330_02690 [Candidatus Dojkabacteria bacterium]|uniref:DUF11 domain-containing protein n=2 Tax=Candidatus Dojkabacteria TaxID=74243 RepID=A0A136KJX6_9BACT|nr:MAG: hypothetical protein UZ20_WS6002000300 [candidate division WS6 bacterium OLB21]MBW7953770.1 DUF11 domain-containing protein [Candidatus Dojkabacteria bacterium]WKZ28481.1 MAG: hypothetical protein QY330_02690 [Candidatus Dojkabacteria bacterium]